jgi:hypothetical protein
MPGEQAATDPGLHEGEPSEEELAEEEEARSQISLAELVDKDLADPDTPSRRDPDGKPEPGSFDVPMEDDGAEPTDAR